MRAYVLIVDGWQLRRGILDNLCAFSFLFRLVAMLMLELVSGHDVVVMGIHLFTVMNI